jgi:hypothetical protein
VTDITNAPFPLLIPSTFMDIGSYASVPSVVNVTWTAAGIGEPTTFYVRFMESGQTPIGQSVALTSDSWLIGFDPIPQRSATANVNFWYIGAPTVPTAMDTSNPDLPGDFHDLIPRKLCVLMAVADGNANAEFYRAAYNDSLLRKLNRVSRGAEGLKEEIQMDWAE